MKVLITLILIVIYLSNNNFVYSQNLETNQFDFTSKILSVITNQKKIDYQYDELGNRISKVVTTSSTNKPPIAQAGTNQIIEEGSFVTLDGSGSNDPDGDAISYLWSAPDGITLSDATAQKPSFTAPEVDKDTTFYIILVVNDGFANSQPDTARITVKDINSGVIETFYGSAQNDGGNRILSVGDGTFISIGSYNSASFLMKTNTLGDTIWRKTFGTNQTFNDIIKTNDGNYIAAGSCGNCGNYRDEGIVYKFDPSGNILWTNKSFEGSDVVIFFKIANTSDNGYILTGTTTNTDGWLDIILLKLSSTGTTEWVRYFGRNRDDTGYDVKQTSDGGYIIAGHSGQWDIPVMWIIKTDSMGNKIWEKAHGGSGCHVNTCAQDQAKSIEIDTDGGYLIFGHRWIDATRQLDAVILKLDADGNLVWEKTYGTEKDDYFFEHQKLKNGNYIIAGDIGQHKVDNSYNGKIFMIDDQFELIDSFSIGGLKNDHLRSITTFNDSIFAAIGNSRSNSDTSSDIWILNIKKVYTNQIVPESVQIANQTFTFADDVCFGATQNITIAGNGTTVTVNAGASAEFIAGQSIHFLPGFHAQEGSLIHGHITTSGSYCVETAPAIMAEEICLQKNAVIVDAKLNELSEREMVVYPNPNSGEFTVEFRNFEDEIRVMLFNSIGQILHEVLTTEREIRMNVPNASSGMYFLKAVNDGKQFNRKIVVK